MRDNPILTAMGGVLVVIDKVERVAAGLLVLFISAVIVLSVLFRYFFGNPIIWAEEACIASFVWLSFIGASIALKRNRHIRIDTFVKYLPKPGRVAMRGFAALVASVLTILLAFLTLEVIPVESQTLTVTLPFAVSKAWMFSVPLLTNASLMAVTSVYFLGCALAGFETEDQLPGLAWTTATSVLDNL